MSESAAPPTERLPLWRAAWVIARRDFAAILLSRAFFFFLLGPLFPIIVGGLAGGIGSQVRETAPPPVLAVAMTASDTERIEAARDSLEGSAGLSLPELAPVEEGSSSPEEVLKGTERNYGAVLSGSLAEPRLTGSSGQLERWRGDIALLLSEAVRSEATVFPAIEESAVAAATSDLNRSRLITAQASQVLLFLLSMLLAGMVLSNLVEEKANKIIEILAASIPMDAVFLGKLFAMLAVSLVGITVWGGVAGIFLLLGGDALPAFPAPVIGWTGFIALGILYFAMNYLLLGSIFLAIGSLATTVREVQTLSMPVTMSQILIFFVASLAVTQIEGWMGIAGMIFPLSSPYVMLAYAAQEGALWPHVLALAWQALFVYLFIKIGASLFRKRVMKSGSQPRGAGRRWRFPGMGRKAERV
ncbi:ABC transporter permease [Qipengyuania atrilutea]|uniref:ABC transporter permease n=1 Tax=Qipengyuania atrilutea TaxID=2744473 RepID=A0A850H1W1_9SPHN|nr:ABC transporter permease [Actirhodobacter atriluteus]NVD44577.1 ABC transporter permease [Actirhodobacter atriluteus]